MKSNIAKIFIMTSLTMLITFIVAMHNIYSSSIIIAYSLVVLPYIAKSMNRYSFFNSLKIILIIVIYMSFVNLLSTYLISSNDVEINNQFISKNFEVDTIIFFVILILTLIFLAFRKYDYTHYYFTILIVLAFIRTLGKGVEGNIFNFINLGMILYLFTVIYYSIYILNIKYFKIKNNVSVYFGLSLSLMTLSLILWDAKQSKLYFKIFEKYKIDEYTIIMLLGFALLLFFYGIYSLFLESKKSSINKVLSK